MRIEVSFVVEWGETHHDRRRFHKEFDVDWSGSPRPGDDIELDIGPPVQDFQFRVGGVSWSVTGPSRLSKTWAWLWLEPIRISLDEVEWQDGFDGYVEHAKRQGWQ